VLEPGAIIDGKYQIVRSIGAGGMGEVFEGENTRIRRRVAIKVLHASAALNPDAVDRFEREAQAAGRIGSDHILEVLDLGALEGGERFIVMEFLEGETLGQRIERLGRLAPQQLAPIMRQALTGLKAAHGAGIIHRDLKPDNVFICREKAGVPDFVKLIDFGISKFHSTGSDMSMTRTGAVMGTPYYMSPEQARGSRDIDQRSDLYAMGVILYEALSGAKPFDAETFNELLFKIVLSTPPPLSESIPDIDRPFESIVYKAMARDAAHRFQSADDFIAALDQWAASGAPVTIPPAIGHGAPPEIPPAGPLPAAGMPPPTGTANGAVWSSTSDDAVIPTKSRAPLFAVLGVLGLVVVGGAGFGVYAVTRHGDTPQAAASNEEATPEATASEAPPPEESAAPVESAAEPAPTESAEPEPETTGSPTTPKPVVAAHTAPKPVAPKPEVKPEPKPEPTKPKPKPKPTGGTDFGY